MIRIPHCFPMNNNIQIVPKSPWKPAQHVHRCLTKFFKVFFLSLGLTVPVVSREVAHCITTVKSHWVTSRASPEGLPDTGSKTDTDICGVALYRAGSSAQAKGSVLPEHTSTSNRTTHTRPHNFVMLAVKPSVAFCMAAKNK